MEPLTWIVANKEILKLAYGILLVLICFFIVLKTHKLFSLSCHQGIRYFRNAFTFFGLAFLARYVIGSTLVFHNNHLVRVFITRFCMEFFLIMAGFFLLYSLIWKHVEKPGEHYFSSLFNPAVLIFYLITFLLVSLDLLWRTYTFMFLSQVIIFTIASAISLINFQKCPKKTFPKFYFIAMVLSLSAWLLNALTAIFYNWHDLHLVAISAINLVIFLVFLFGVMSFTRLK